MRYASKRKSSYVLPALAAAGLAGMLGVPAAHGDFIITLTEVTGPTTSIGSLSGTSAGPSVGNANTEDFVVSALNNGLNGTGTDLLALDATINSSNPLVIDLNNDIDDDGTQDANIVGFPDQSADSGAGTGVAQAIPSFGVAYNAKVATTGNPFAGSIIGVAKVQTGANAPKNLAFADNSFTVVAVQLGTNIGTANENFYESSQGPVDPSFLNGTVTSMRVVGAFASATFKGPAANLTAVPFANIVVPVGTTGTVSGQLNGDIGSPVNFSVAFGGTGPTPTVNALASLAATAVTTAAAANNLGSITITGHNGSYNAQTVAVPSGAAQTAAELTATFPDNGQEIYGLAASSSNLATLISQLNAAIGSADAGASAVAVSSLSASLQSVLAGDTIAVEIPGADMASPNIFSYDLNGNGVPSGSSISSITVVPEPTGIGALVLGGLGLLSRRKRREA